MVGFAFSPQEARKRRDVHTSASAMIKENNFFYEKYKHLKLSKEMASAFLQAMIGDGENGKK